MRLILNEDLFDDDIVVAIEDEVEPTPDVEQDMKDGLANLINNDLVGELQTISQYRNSIDAAEIVNPDMVPVIDDIVEEENKHIGQLETLLTMISEPAEEIEAGKLEAEQQLDMEPDFAGGFTPDDDLEGLEI